MRKSKTLILTGLFVSLLLFACQPEQERKKYTGTYVEQTAEEVTLNVVCNSEYGPNCDIVYEYLQNLYNRTLLRKFYTYYDLNNIAGFIQNEPWQQLFTSVPQVEINKVLAGTYKLVVSKPTNTVLIVRNLNGDYSASNVVYAFKAAS
jgi:hypothetical protein